jgi:hypothetical protein
MYRKGQLNRKELEPVKVRIEEFKVNNPDAAADVLKEFGRNIALEMYPSKVCPVSVIEHLMDKSQAKRDLPLKPEQIIQVHKMIKAKMRLRAGPGQELSQGIIDFVIKEVTRTIPGRICNKRIVQAIHQDCPMYEGMVDPDVQALNERKKLCADNTKKRKEEARVRQAKIDSLLLEAEVVAARLRPLAGYDGTAALPQTPDNCNAAHEVVKDAAVLQRDCSAMQARALHDTCVTLETLSDKVLSEYALSSWALAMTLNANCNLDGYTPVVEAVMGDIDTPMFGGASVKSKRYRGDDATNLSGNRKGAVKALRVTTNKTLPRAMEGSVGRCNELARRTNELRKVVVPDTVIGNVDHEAVKALQVLM